MCIEAVLASLALSLRSPFSDIRGFAMPDVICLECTRPIDCRIRVRHWSIFTFSVAFQLSDIPEEPEGRVGIKPKAPSPLHSTMSPLVPPAGPLILTLTLDKTTRQFLTGLRSKYFPPHRNFLSAHVTLFHAISPHRIQELDGYLNDICKEQKGWEVFIGEPKKMGKGGVMVSVRERPSGTIEAIREDLVSNLKRNTTRDQDKLTEQDQRRMGKPHVTVLNKAESEEQVMKCLKEVEEEFEKLKQPGQKVGQQKGNAIGFEL